MCFRMKNVYIMGMFIMAMVISCNKNDGPVRKGSINLSSELLGVETYFIYGYNFKKSDYIQFSLFQSMSTTKPDIINYPFKNPDGTIGAPGFNAPSGKNGFHLLGEFNSLNEARTFYDDYPEVQSNLTYEVDSDTVRKYQVWLQKTQLDQYAKLLVTDIAYYNESMGESYVVVSMDFTYQDDGTGIFP